MNTRYGGRYELGKQIGVGGMGAVYEATDVETGRVVAAKVMLASGEDNLDALLRFQQEGAVLSTLKHPNIVEVFGTFLEQHSSCIIMELLIGPSLAQVIRAERLSLPRVKHIITQVTSALEYAHGRAIVHRDVKPDNIMLCPGDVVKVTDFGIARILRSGATLNTMTGMSIGTPLYMAPEQIEGLKVDGRADIYSLGAVVYQLVTGRPPFEGEDPLTIAFKHVHKAPQPPSQVAEVPADWEALILQMLAKDPADRVPAGGLQGAIEALSVPNTGRSAVPTVLAPAFVPPPPAPRSTTPEPAAGPRQVAAAPQATAAAAIPASRFEPQPAASQPAPPPVARPTLAAAPGATVMQQSPEDRTSNETVVGIAPISSNGAVRKQSVAVPAPATKRRTGIWPIAGAIAALLVIAGVAAFFLLNKKSTPTTTAAPPPPVATPVTLALAVNGASGTNGFASGQLVGLRWTPLKGASYRLQLATGAPSADDATLFSHPLRSKLTTSNVYQQRVIGGQDYFWRVQARLNGKWGAFTPSNHFVVAPPIIAAPQALTRNGIRVVARPVRLCWSAVNGAVDYRLRIDGNPAFTATATCAVVSARRGVHRWRVAARVPGVRLYVGPFSAVSHFRVLPKPKPAPIKKKQPTPSPTAVPVQQQQPVQQQPVQQQPVQQQPVQQQPVQQQPVQQQPVQQQPVQQQPVQQQPVQQQPVQQQPVQPAPKCNPEDPGCK